MNVCLASQQVMSQLLITYKGGPAERGPGLRFTFLILTKTSHSFFFSLPLSLFSSPVCLFKQEKEANRMLSIYVHRNEFISNFLCKLLITCVDAMDAFHDCNCVSSHMEKIRGIILYLMHPIIVY